MPSIAHRTAKNRQVLAARLLGARLLVDRLIADRGGTVLVRYSSIVLLVAIAAIAVLSRTEGHF